MPPKGGSLRDALPVVERLWRTHVGERVRLTLGWGTEPLPEAAEVRIEEIEAWIARWEAESRLELGEGDVYLDAPDFRVILCHDADLHLESANADLLAAAMTEFSAMCWRCVEAEKR